jgi:hypothetical protein
MIEKYVHLQKRPWVLHEQEELCVLSPFAGAKAALTLWDTVETQPVKTSIEIRSSIVCKERQFEYHIIQLTEVHYTEVPTHFMVYQPSFVIGRGGSLVAKEGHHYARRRRLPLNCPY